MLTFRGSPLFGLQGREGAHDSPHGSEDLCESWDPRPCLFPPLKRNRCGLPTLNWRRGKARKQKKAPGSSPAAWYSESVGPGLLELVAAAFFSQAHALTLRASGSREPSQAPPAPVRAPSGATSLSEGQAPSPKTCLTLDTGPACPPGRGCRARAACGAGAALRPPAPAATRPLRPALGLDLRGPSTNHE